MPEDNPNVTSEMKYRKLPINWLPTEFRLIEKIAQDEYFGCKAQYIRRCVAADLRHRGLVGQQGQGELFPEFEEVQLEKRKVGVLWKNLPSYVPVKDNRLYVDPPRKFSGFSSGLRRNIGIACWFTKKKRESQDNLL